ncbi:hypothetical protein ACFT30_10110 [Microbacterium ureisolvens]
MLDVIYLATTIALFALVGLIAKGAGRLVADATGPANRGAQRGEDRS